MINLFHFTLIENALIEYPKPSIKLFLKYHSENPKIYENFCKYALQMARSGRKRYGAKGVMERIRWDYAMKYNDEDFKISNSYTAMYSRLAMYEHDELQGFFKTKKVKGIKKITKADLND